jgi:HK97 family phage portal protein
MFKPKRPEQHEAYAAVYPTYEVTTPQYPQPNPYNMAYQGYRADEVVYACVGLRSNAVAEASLIIKDANGDVVQHKLTELIARPNERLSGNEFWQITEIYLQIAGFCAWEIERNRLGEPVNLWAMRPDWCSFYRGEGRPLRAVRYQPYGLPPVDISIDNILLFQYFDPVFPLLKGLSPTAIAFRSISADNNTSNFIADFFQNGAQFTGLLTTTQSLSQQEADRIKQLWQSQHGGVGNWSAPAVLGNGVTYQNTGMTFQQMQFGDLDARMESRICSVFGVPPILIGAKVGLDRSTFSNFAEARRAFYDNPIKPEWRFLASSFGAQMLEDGLTCEFDLKDITILQEDRTAKWQRAIQASTAGLLTRDEARKEMGLDAIDNAHVFTTWQPSPIEAAETDEPEPDEANEELASLERKRFTDFARKRQKEGNEDKIASFKFRYLSKAEQVQLLKGYAETELAKELKRANDLMEARK